MQSIGVCCSHKVVAVGFNTLCYDAECRRKTSGIKASARINANAFNKAKDKNLSGFLEYVKTGKVTTDFTGRIEKMIEKVKSTEQARSEYRFISAFEMDARRAGIQEGIQAGIAQGFTDGIMQTAKKLLEIGLSVEDIAKATGLSKEEIEKL